MGDISQTFFPMATTSSEVPSSGGIFGASTLRSLNTSQSSGIMWKIGVGILAFIALILLIWIAVPHENLNLQDIRKDLVKLQDKVDNYHKHNIVFSAYSAPSSSQTIETGNLVYFNQTMVKSPETKLDLSTGTFTASVNGIYEFSYSGGCLNSDKITRITVKQKGQSKLTFEHYGSDRGGYGLMNINWI